MPRPNPIVVHVNVNTIKSNTKNQRNNPPIIVRRKSRSTKPVYCHDADFLVNGQKIGGILHRPYDPLDCGARVWIELDPSIVEVVPRKESPNVRQHADPHGDDQRHDNLCPAQ
jgi:hypothetical protein